MSVQREDVSVATREGVATRGVLPDSTVGTGNVGGVRVSSEMASPRYARGAGPYVDKYVLKDREEKKQKQLEHVVST